MLLLVLMLQAVTPAPAKISHVRLTRRPAATRSVAARMHLMPDCRLARNCAISPDEDDRLLPQNTTLADPKQEALRGPSNCGVVGMPVCPSHGRQMFRTTLGD
jgi:hypothetical protein